MSRIREEVEEAASRHGHFDLTSYQKYMAGELKDFEYPEDELQRSLKNLPTTGN